MSKEILILKHIDIEGPGSMQEFFQNTTWRLKIIDLTKEDLPLGDFADIEAIISLGGPMNVYEEDKYPFLKSENEFLQRAIKEEIPILGICLGAQLLAKACGAQVKKARQKEIGWHRVNLTAEGEQDALFLGLPIELDVFQWHGDTFEIPDGGALLAKSQACTHQAFRLGRNAYGLQFHIEITPAMVESWLETYTQEETRAGKDMLSQAYKREEGLRKTAQALYLNFARIIKESQRVVSG